MSNSAKQNNDKDNRSIFLIKKIWTDEEEKQLLEEIDKDMKKNEIAIKHNRTIGGINSRIIKIAYKIYKLQNIIYDL